MLIGTSPRVFEKIPRPPPTVVSCERLLTVMSSSRFTLPFCDCSQFFVLVFDVQWSIFLIICSRIASCEIRGFRRSWLWSRSRRVLTHASIFCWCESDSTVFCKLCWNSKAGMWKFKNVMLLRASSDWIMKLHDWERLRLTENVPRHTFQHAQEALHNAQENTVNAQVDLQKLIEDGTQIDPRRVFSTKAPAWSNLWCGQRAASKPSVGRWNPNPRKWDSKWCKTVRCRLPRLEGANSFCGGAPSALEQRMPEWPSSGKTHFWKSWCKRSRKLQDARTALATWC